MLGRDRPREALEDAALIGGSDADALIARREDGLVAGGPCNDLDRLARAVLDGIRNEIGNHLSETNPVPNPDSSRRSSRRQFGFARAAWKPAKTSRTSVARSTSSSSSR